MKFRKTTSKTVAQDLRAYADWLEKDAKPAEKKETASWLNERLDELWADDAFGTEGQCDPRGDHRG